MVLVTNINLVDAIQSPIIDGIIAEEIGLAAGNGNVDVNVIIANAVNVIDGISAATGSFYGPVGASALYANSLIVSASSPSTTDGHNFQFNVDYQGHVFHTANTMGIGAHHSLFTNVGNIAAQRGAHLLNYGNFFNINPGTLGNGPRADTASGAALVGLNNSFGLDLNLGILNLGNGLTVGPSPAANISVYGNVAIGKALATAPYQLDLTTDNARKLTTTAWATGSDRRIKANIQSANIDTCLHVLKSLPLRRFEWAGGIEAEDRRVVGWIAQEVEAFFPHAITQTAEHGLSDFRSLQPDQLYKVTYGAVQKLAEIVDALSARVDALAPPPQSTT